MVPYVNARIAPIRRDISRPPEEAFLKAKMSQDLTHIRFYGKYRINSVPIKADTKSVYHIQISMSRVSYPLYLLQFGEKSAILF